MSEYIKDIVSSKRNIATSMSAIGVALLTFTIQFFYQRITNNEIPETVVSAIFATIILSIFCFAVAVLYYQNSLELCVLRCEDPQMVKDNKNGDLFFFVGFFSLLFEPAIILWTIKLLFIALLSLIFWALLLSFVVFRRRS